jgi:hypothetical protein
LTIFPFLLLKVLVRLSKANVQLQLQTARELDVLFGKKTYLDYWIPSLVTAAVSLCTSRAQDLQASMGWVRLTHFGSWLSYGIEHRSANHSNVCEGHAREPL